MQVHQQQKHFNRGTETASAKARAKAKAQQNNYTTKK